MGPSDGPRAGLTSKQAQHKQGDGLPVPKGRRTAKSSSLEQRLSRLQPTRPPALITHRADFPSEEEAARRAAEPLGTKTFPSPPAEARGSPIEMVSKSNPTLLHFLRRSSYFTFLRALVPKGEVLWRRGKLCHHFLLWTMISVSCHIREPHVAPATPCQRAARLLTCKDLWFGPGSSRKPNKGF